MPNGATGFASSALEPWPEEKKEPMKTRKNKTNDDSRREYDLGQLHKGGVRGKYA
jgi:hypothetical protein